MDPLLCWFLIACLCDCCLICLGLFGGFVVVFCVCWTWLVCFALLLIGWFWLVVWFFDYFGLMLRGFCCLWLLIAVLLVLVCVCVLILFNLCLYFGCFDCSWYCFDVGFVCCFVFSVLLGFGYDVSLLFVLVIVVSWCLFFGFKFWVLLGLFSLWLTCWLLILFRLGCLRCFKLCAIVVGIVFLLWDLSFGFVALMCWFKFTLGCLTWLDCLVVGVV